MSQDHVIGSHAISRVATTAGVSRPSKFTATKMRHKMSTLYAQLDLPDQDRDLFYKRMGHSASMNSNVYQCPMAALTVTRVRKHLHNFDKGNVVSYFAL